MTVDNPSLSSQIILPRPETDREREIFEALADRDKELAERIEEIDGLVGGNLGIGASGLNTVSDPGFEESATGDLVSWYETLTVNGVATIEREGYSGFQSVKLSAPAVGDRSRVGQNLGTLSGTHIVQFWTKGDGSNAGFYQIYDSGGSSPIAATSTGVTAATWTLVTASFTPGANATHVILWSPVGAGGGVHAFFDDVTVAPAITYGNIDQVFYEIYRQLMQVIGAWE